MSIGGIVICRQRPGTAKDVVFVSVGDETGVANAIVPPELFEQRRLCISEEPFLQIDGDLQNMDGVIHIKARAISALRMDAIATPMSHDFR